MLSVPGEFVILLCLLTTSRKSVLNLKEIYEPGSLC